MKAYKKIMSFILALGLLVSSLYISDAKTKVHASSVSYEAIQYGDKVNGNWGYILVPKGASGKLQAGFAVHGLSGENNAVSNVKSALKRWGDAGYDTPMIIIMPMITYYKSDMDTVYKFRDYVKNNLPSVIDQMDNGTFNKLIKDKGYNCSIDTSKGYFITGWSLGGSVAAYAGSKYKDKFPYVGSLSPAPSTHTEFLQADSDTLKYSYSTEPGHILMMAGSIPEMDEQAYHVMKGFYQMRNGNCDFFVFEHGMHHNNLFMTELFIFLYAVNHDGTYPTEDMITQVYPNQIEGGKNVPTKLLSFPDESDQAANHKWNGNTCSVCGAKKNQNAPDKKSEEKKTEEKKTEATTEATTEAATEAVTEAPKPELTVKVTSETDITVDHKSPYTMSVEATGSNLTYNWQYSCDNQYWTDTTRTNRNGKPTMIVDDATRDVYYHCVVSDGETTKVSESIAVHVRPIINSVTSTGYNVELVPGETYTISVSATGLELSYKWQYSLDNKTWVDSINNGKNTDTVEYINHPENHVQALYYRCQVTSAGTTVTTDPIRLGK